VDHAVKAQLFQYCLEWAPLVDDWPSIWLSSAEDSLGHLSCPTRNSVAMTVKKPAVTPPIGDTRVPRTALIEAAAIRHQHAVRQLSIRYAGIVCSDLTDDLSAELKRVSGLPVFDTKALLTLERPSFGARPDLSN